MDYLLSHFRLNATDVMQVEIEIGLKGIRSNSGTFSS